MRDRIFGGIGIVWGGLVLINGLVAGAQGSGAYATGRSGGMVFGGLLLCTGLYYVLRKPPAAK
jgi:hypothetical protein